MYAFNRESVFAVDESLVRCVFRMRSPNPAEVSRGAPAVYHDPAKSQTNTTMPSM